MKTKQLNRSYFMKGVSDTIYLAFVGILSVGGAVYIYNDINANKSALAISSESEKPISVASQETAPLNETKQESNTTALAVEEKVAIIETQESNSQVAVTKTPEVQNEQANPVAEAVIEKANIKTELLTETQSTATTESTVEVQADIIETKTVETTASTVPVVAPTTENATTETITTTENIPVTNTSEVSAQNSVATSQEMVNTEAVNSNPATTNNNMPMPVPNMQGFMPPEYNYQMHQAARYMPQPYMQEPYYGDNRNYQVTYEQKQYELQQYEQQRAQQQRRQYQNTNNPYPDQYTPWNPGRFY